MAYSARKHELNSDPEDDVLEIDEAEWDDYDMHEYHDQSNGSHARSDDASGKDNGIDKIQSKLERELALIAVDKHSSVGKTNDGKDKKTSVTNADLMQTLNMILSRVKDMEGALAKMVALQQQMIQSTPTFVSSGKSGILRITKKE